MNRIERQWLAASSWQSVISTNEALCKDKELPHELKENHDKARQLWEQKAPQSMPLEDAINLCRQCLELAPFGFYNANTFSSVGTSMLETVLNRFPPPEAQILRRSVRHYIAGRISEKELKDVLDHFQVLWKKHANDPEPGASPSIATGLPPKATATSQLPPRPNT